MGKTTVGPQGAVEATVNYFPRDGDRVMYPGTAGYQRRKLLPRTITITDVRGQEEDFTLDNSGFQLAQDSHTEVEADADDAMMKNIAYPETIKLVTKLTNAKQVLPFSHQTRRATAEEVQAASQNLDSDATLPAVGPTRFAHLDSSAAGAVGVLKENLPESEVPRWERNRWAIINVWRPLGRTVTRDPLAVLHAMTVADEDLIPVWAAFPKKKEDQDEKDVAFGSVYAAGSGFETAQVCLPIGESDTPEHKWFYVSDLQVDEALVFKQFDSATDGRARRTPHSAFQCERDHGQPRWSYEVRCLVLWEDEVKN